MRRYRRHHIHTCSNCPEKFSNIYCSRCKIWTPLEIYHCDKCGLCRIGSLETTWHCDKCAGCFPTSGRAQHICTVQELTSARCQWCLEQLFGSQKQTSILSCAHAAHTECFKKSIYQGDFRCPECRKTLCDMRNEWQSMRDMILIQPIPKELYPISIGSVASTSFGNLEVTSVNRSVVSSSGSATMISGRLVNWKLDNGKCPTATFSIYAVEFDTTVLISCNDCNSRSRCPFHFLGLECQYCGSFNTVQV